MNIVNLDHFVLIVKDLKQSVDFYHNVIGLPIISDQTNDNFASLKCGNSLLRFRKLSNDVGAIVANNLSTGNFDFCLESSDSVANIINNFKQHNISIELGPVTKHGAKGKMTSVYVRDPDGNLVEISSYN
ncbi:VOC family protein [Lactobacillus hamsteri]|uniref:VOC family protein n=1 Tax=Lactobacillus hamsteri TaxID=96565 RepID=UPI00046909E1|nr:VOC family protein [Lactobacillus hamsteri]